MEHAMPLRPIGADSRLEIILDRKTSGWDEFEAKLVQCLA